MSLPKFVLVGLLLAVFAAPLSAYAQNTLLAADFDDKAIDMPIGTGGPAVGEPTYVDPFIEAIVRDEPLPTPCLEISDIDDYYAGKAKFKFLDDVEVMSGHLTMTCTLWFEYDPDGAGYTIYFRERDSGAFDFLSLSFLGDGAVYCYDSNSNSPQLATFDTGRPVPLAVSFDLDAGTYTIWLDGVGIRWNDSYGTVGPGIGTVIFGCTHDGNTEGTFYVDDILITDEPMISAVEFGDLVAPVRLNHCFPNPFNPRTTISLELDRAEPVRLEIFDVAGRRIKTLHDGHLGTGSHTFSWDGRSDGGNGVSSGSYFCRLVGRTWSESRTMMLVR